MRRDGSTAWKSRLSGIFTLPGKSRPVARRESARLKVVGVTFLLLASAEPAAARPQIGPTSSTSVSISLSVAPQYGLATNGPSIRTSGPAGEGTYCLATNGQPTVLPVLLIRLTAAQTGSAPSNGPAEPLPWCVSGSDAPPAAGRADDGSASGLLMIRPE